MSILDRYIARALIQGWVMVALVLSAVFGLLAFVEELNHIGFRYQLVDVLRFVAMTTPQRAVDLAPVHALLGSLIALASLARNSEMTVIWATGVTPAQFFRAVAKPTLGAVVVLVLVSQYVCAPLYRQAETERNMLRSGNTSLVGAAGLWTTDGRRFTNVKQLRLGQIPAGIEIYQFGHDGELTRAIYADHASIHSDRTWTLYDLEDKQLIGGKLVSRKLDRLNIGPLWSEDELPVLSYSTEGMTPTMLYGYARYLEQTGQSADQYALAFWKKVTLPLAAGVMVLLAVPIGAAPGTARSRSFGLKAAAGAVIGILFYLVSQLIYATGQLLNLHPSLVALMPTLIVGAVAAWLWWRMRR